MQDLNAADLGAHVHSLTSLSGQLGFMELSALCAELDDSLDEGGGSDRIVGLGAAIKASDRDHCISGRP